MRHGDTSSGCPCLQGVLFAVGSLFVAESPRWLFRRGDRDKALASLLRSRSTEAAHLELAEMEALAAHPNANQKRNGTLFRRKYVVPFLLACVILACNTATGINSIIGYNTSILLQSGLSDLASHWGYVIFTGINFLMTLVGMMLVDRKGRRFLLVLGTSGVMLSLVATATLFHQTERNDLEVGSSSPDTRHVLQRPRLCTSVRSVPLNSCRPVDTTTMPILRRTPRWPSSIRIADSRVQRPTCDRMILEVRRSTSLATIRSSGKRCACLLC